MTTLRPMTPLDLYRFGNINLDHFTETFFLSFYLSYLSRYPELCVTAVSADNSTLAGYVMGKVEGEDKDWHGHVTALSIAPEFRRGGLARRLMEDVLEKISDEVFRCYYVDLYVKVSNKTAITFYSNLGYEVYQVVPNYYSGIEDAYDMRKPLSMDIKRECLLNPDQSKKERTWRSQSGTPDPARNNADGTTTKTDKDVKASSQQKPAPGVKGGARGGRSTKGRR
eukprot:GHVQ01013048.1.p1 GENE.GHVQ01013048.1~~GHVQ01013048.1.p1  ORF type:complete len:225 (-),score=19.52 GHVQ01013048.1:847-1521(-)